MKTLFQDHCKKFEFISPGPQFGTGEWIFKEKEVAEKIVKETRENEKWLLFPNCLGRVTRRTRIGANSTAIKIKSVLAVVRMRIEEYKILSLKTNKTLFWREYCLEANVLLEEKDFNRIQEVVEIKFRKVMKILNVIMQGRRPLCSRCSKRGHFQADCGKRSWTEQTEMAEA